jgi:hypothetical protein
MYLCKRQILWLLIFILISIAYPVAAAEKVMSESFPIGELFEPLIAYPKEIQFSAGFHKVDSSGRLGKFTASVVSYGEYFGLLRKRTANDHLWQLSIGGALFAQFNMKADSKDLINADYSVGLSATHKHGPLSSRFRLFHQSTHLGDELLLSGSAPKRVNFSLEGIDFLGAYVWDTFRFYGGAGYLLSVEPKELDRLSLQAGGEFHDTKLRLFGGRWIGGTDLQAFEGDNWRVNTAVKAGLEFGKPGSGNRRIRIMLELYDGKSPYGQFYDVEVKSYGFACYLLF